MKASSARIKRKPLEVAGKARGTVHVLGKGRVVHIADFSDPVEVLQAAMQGMDLVRFGRNDPGLDVTIHRSDKDRKRLIVFIANPTADPIQAEVNLDFEVKSARELWEDRTIQAHGRVLAESMQPYSIKILECAL